MLYSARHARLLEKELAYHGFFGSGCFALLRGNAIHTRDLMDDVLHLVCVVLALFRWHYVGIRARLIRKEGRNLSFALFALVF